MTPPRAGIGLAIWLALTPMVAARYHMITFSGLLIGPPLVLLTSIALISGFLLLLCAAIFPPLVAVLALPSTALAEFKPSAPMETGRVSRWKQKINPISGLKSQEPSCKIIGISLKFKQNR